jgi:hypothetical protein
MGNSKGEEIFQSFCFSLLEVNVHIHKLMSNTADADPALTSQSVG